MALFYNVGQVLPCCVKTWKILMIFLMLVKWGGFLDRWWKPAHLNTQINQSFFVSAGYAQTDTDWSANTGSTCAASASDSTRKTSASLRQVLYLLYNPKSCFKFKLNASTCKADLRVLLQLSSSVPNSFAMLGVLVYLMFVFVYSWTEHFGLTCPEMDPVKSWMPVYME